MPDEFFHSSNRISPDPSDSQTHVGAASSVQPTHSFIGFMSGTGMAIADAWFCAQRPILVLMFVFGSLSCWMIQTWPVIRFLVEVVEVRF